MRSSTALLHVSLVFGERILSCSRIATDSRTRIVIDLRNKINVFDYNGLKTASVGFAHISANLDLPMATLFLKNNLTNKPIAKTL